MKTVLKIILGVVLIILLSIGAAFYFTKDMVTVADAFFAHLNPDTMEQTEAYLSEAFLASTTLDELETYARENMFFDVQSANWNSRSFAGKKGELKGSIVTAENATVPLTITFVKEAGSWKIFHLSAPSAGIDDEPVVTAVPTEREMVEMVRRTMALFAAAVNEDSMASFYEACSSVWQQQITPEKLNEIFSVFMEKNIDLTVLENFSPQFNAEPEIDENGILRVAGMYATEPSKVHFKQSYVYEGLGWKLFGISVDIQ